MTSLEFFSKEAYQRAFAL